ncbi:MAG: hypothetical protein ACMX3H_14695, partial [Sodalis sp. (in: enterobacteria)]
GPYNKPTNNSRRPPRGAYAQIAKNTPSAANVVGYANVVRDKATERFALRQANQITELFYERNGMSAAEKLEVAQRMIT